jgi:hypothetical protein
MRTDHAATPKFSSRWRGAVRSSFTKPVVFCGYFAVSSIATATNAAAHVKWFVNCNVSDAPLPIYEVFTATFFQCLALFLSLFYFGCMAERTALGSVFSRLLDRCTAPIRNRADELLRAAAAISFALLWADGGVILTPELKASSMSLSAIQLLIPIYLFSRATLPAAGLGIIVLYGYGVAAYGLFHMLDYPVFIGMGIFFMLAVSQNVKLRALRFHVLRWTVALSLLWPAMEKFLYPSWVAAIGIVHPELTLGLPVPLVITAAGIVEFGLTFALFWTPMVRRLAAFALILLLTSATFDFGKVDGIGHMIIVVILLVIVADPEGKPQRCHPAFAPLVSSLALLATIFLYSGGHTLYYGSKSAALAPLSSGLALLVFIGLCLLGLPQAWFQVSALLWRWVISGTFGNAQHGSSLRTSPAAATAWSSSPDVIRQRRRRSVAVRFADRISPSTTDHNGSRANPVWGLHPGSSRPLD